MLTIEKVCRELEWSLHQKSLVDAYMQKFGRRFWCMAKFCTDLNNWVAMSMLVQGPRETALSVVDSYVKFEGSYHHPIFSKPL